MKEYNVTLTLKMEAEKADYEQVDILSQKISDELIHNNEHDDIEIIEVNIENIDDFNDYDIDLGEDFDDY